MLIDNYQGSISDWQLWQDEPALWIIKHSQGYRTETNPAAARGHAVEHAGNQLLANPKMSVDEAIAHAQDAYIKSRAVPKDADPEMWFTVPEMNEWNDIPGFVAQMREALICLELPKPKRIQNKVTGTIEGVPIRGFTDWEWDDRLIDLKTTRRCPVTMRFSHQEQQTFYSDSTGLPAACLYVTPKKWEHCPLTEEMQEAGRNRVEAMARGIRATLQFPSWDALVPMYPPRDLGGFRWDEKARFLASGIWSV